MQLQINDRFTKNDHTVLDYYGLEGQDPVWMNLFQFETYLKGPDLEILDALIVQQFSLRYPNRDSRFFHPASLIRMVNAAYAAATKNEFRNAIFEYEYDRFTAMTEWGLDFGHPFTVEISIEKAVGEPITLYSEWRKRDYIFREMQIVTTINPEGIMWDPILTKFIGHVDANYFNGCINMHVESFMSTVKEEFQEQEDARLLAGAEQAYDDSFFINGEWILPPLN